MAQSSNPDLQLVQKAVKGSRKAFTTLFNRYFQSVYNFALLLSRDPAMAEDLTQETFIRAHTNLERFGPPWNFRTWIFRLTRNYFIDLTRKERGIIERCWVSSNPTSAVCRAFQIGCTACSTCPPKR